MLGRTPHDRACAKRTHPYPDGNIVYPNAKENKDAEILDAVHQDIKDLSQGGRKGRKGDCTSENILRALIELAPGWTAETRVQFDAGVRTEYVVIAPKNKDALLRLTTYDPEEWRTRQHNQRMRYR